MTKYIFVTGGVVSGLGKGITAASLGRLLKMRGLKVAAHKPPPGLDFYRVKSNLPPFRQAQRAKCYIIIP